MSGFFKHSRGPQKYFHSASLLGGIALAVVWIAFSLPAAAQVLYGSITGNITDTAKAAVPAATVTLTNQGTGEVRTTVANGSGLYNVLDVLPGTYTVSVAPNAGFAGFQEKDVQVEPNRQVRVDITLQPGTVNTQVLVTSAPPELQTESGEVNTEISQSELQDMPLSGSEGRSYQSLYTLIPGANNVSEQNSVASNPSRAMAVNINGADNDGNTTRIDGAVNYYGWLPYLIAYVPPPDSIENVSVSTNSFNAEQGQAGGASIKITTKSGTSKFHGGAWEYYQDAAFNARPYTTTVQVEPTIPKNVFNQYGFNIGGPVYIPRVLTGRKKLFFFDNFERTTRRQLFTSDQALPDYNMIQGNFSEAASINPIYDPAPTVPSSQWFTPSTACPALAYTNGFLNYPCRPTFTQEYGETGSGVNTIPASRISPAAATMIANFAPIAKAVGTPTAAEVALFMQNDYLASATLAYNRITNDAKITYIPSEKTQVFGKYSIEPSTVIDPQPYGAAGGGPLDGGQPGAATGRIQNVGLGGSHVFTPNLVLDADFGYTRQLTGAQSTLDLSVGDYGLDVLKIPGTNGVGQDYVGQPPFEISGFMTIGDAGFAAPYKFRDNQFTGDVNLSWNKGKHDTKYGFTYYHFDLNHFQPTSGGGVTNVRGGFLFAGGMTCTGTSTCSRTAYNSLADYLLGLPNGNNTTTQVIAKAAQVSDPNSLRWTELGAYAQDQWHATAKLTVDYGVRYEMYPAPYRDHSGVFIADPNLPQTRNVEIGGLGGNPEDAGLDMGKGFWAPRFGFAYLAHSTTSVHGGFGLTTDPTSLRYLRDTYPEDLTSSYVSTGPGTIAVDPANTTHYATGEPMTLTYGIPVLTAPNLSSGFVSLPIAGSTVTTPKNYHRGYLETWNMILQQDFGHNLVFSLGYIGDHMVRQTAGISPYNSAPLPSGATSCMANGQWNPSTGLSGACSYQVNTIFSQKYCGGVSNCYNSGGMAIDGPVFSSMYNGMQAQLRHNTTNASFGVVYSWSHAIDYADNGAGTGGGGVTFNYPTSFYLNKGSSGFDHRQNLQIFGSYSLPFGYGQRFASSGWLGQVIGGWKLNGQFSHISGSPFSVTSNTNVLGGFAPGWGTTYAQMIKPYRQIGGHNRTLGNNAVSGGRPWFDISSFESVPEPTYTASMTPSQIPSPVLPNTGRNEFTGPGTSVMNASLFRGFHIYRESQFQIRFEAFNVFNHPQLGSPNAGVPTAANIASGNTGTFGLITGFGATRSLQFGGRILF